MSIDNPTDELKRAVFSKGRPAPGFNSNEWRYDICGTAIKYVEYGRQTKNGWEIDHIRPEAKGGGDEFANLQPLQWENNRRKGDAYPWNG